MAIITWRETRLECDGDECLEEVHYIDMTMKDAKKGARTGGWSIGKTVKCPECRRQAPQ